MVLVLKHATIEFNSSLFTLWSTDALVLTPPIQHLITLGGP